MTSRVLVGAFVAAVLGGILDFHGVALALWCVSAVVVLAAGVPYAWSVMRYRRDHIRR